MLERGTRSRPRIDTIRSLTAALGPRTPPRPSSSWPLPAARASRPRSPAPQAEIAGRRATHYRCHGNYRRRCRTSPAGPRRSSAMLSVLRAPAGARSDAVGLVTVTGMGGIGKTALAVQAAHKLADSYPDGHLYLNLRGYGPGQPMSTADALRQLLRSLGLDIQLIPDGVEEAAALLRSQLAGRRVLMLLDNAADVPQVMPLLPGSPGSAAIITSRGSLAALPGARQIRLDALSESESVELLTGVIGRSRVAAEPDAAEMLASFTGRLPLAVRLIGGRLAARPAWPIQHLVDRARGRGTPARRPRVRRDRRTREYRQLRPLPRVQRPRPRPTGSAGLAIAERSGRIRSAHGRCRLPPRRLGPAGRHHPRTSRRSQPDRVGRA